MSLCPFPLWSLLSLNLPCLICHTMHSQQYSMRCLQLTSPSLYSPFLANVAANISFLAFCTAILSPKNISRLSFCHGGLSPINDVFISPAVSNYSKLQGKVMPAVFCAINLVHFYAFQVILIITHFDEIYPFNL